MTVAMILLILAAFVFVSAVFTITLSSTGTAVALFWALFVDNHWIETKEERDAWRDRDAER